jgi:hypothetical protein
LFAFLFAVTDLGCALVTLCSMPCPRSAPRAGLAADLDRP